jgi:hypothetical protein
VKKKGSCCARRCGYVDRFIEGLKSGVPDCDSHGRHDESGSSGFPSITLHSAPMARLLRFDLMLTPTSLSALFSQPTSTHLDTTPSLSIPSVALLRHTIVYLHPHPAPHHNRILPWYTTNPFQGSKANIHSLLGVHDCSRSASKTPTNEVLILQAAALSAIYTSRLSRCL